MSTRVVKFLIVFSLCFSGYDLFALGRYGSGQTWAALSLSAGVVAVTCGLVSLRMRNRKDVRR